MERSGNDTSASDAHTSPQALSLSQTVQLSQQLKEEVNAIVLRVKVLREAIAKFRQTIDAINSVSKLEEGSEGMFPMTASVYVPGRVRNPNTFLVDIDTGYYVEKSGKNAVTYYERKIAMVSEKTNSLEKIVRQKLQYIEMIDSSLRRQATKGDTPSSSEALMSSGKECTGKE